MTDGSAAQIARWATVRSVDLAAATAVVAFADDGDDSPALPWLERRMGATATWCPPSVGEQVLLVCPDGDIGLGVIIGGLPQDARRAPGNTDEALILFEDGARIAYDPQAHRLTAQLPDAATVEVRAKTMRLIGDVAIEGDVTLTGKLTAEGDVKGAGVSLSQHRHPGVQSGTSRTLPPG